MKKIKLFKTTNNWFLVFLSLVVLLASCQKDVNTRQSNDEILLSASRDHGHLKQTKTFTSQLVVRWINLQLDMMRVPMPAGTGGQGANRTQAYCGIALYESVVKGMPAYQSLTGQLTDFPAMPSTEPGKAYHWAASANAALADMNRYLFPTTADVNKTSINNLENTLKNIYANEVDDATLQRSIAFGKEVAARVFNWAATDGSANVNPPYVVPVGPGQWVPTAPTPPVGSFIPQFRFLVPGSEHGAVLPPPPAYSTDPSSPFFAMAKNVYDKSLELTPDQSAMAIYNRDAPGYPGGGHFVSILSQAFNKAKPTLDVAALAYAKVGLAQYDVTIVIFKNKYNYNVVRPITYIRNVMGHVNWSPLIPTPNHPEYPAAHSATSGAVFTMLTDVLGENFQLTLHTYDYLGLPSRSFNSFDEIGLEMSNSRMFAGVHYQASCDNGRALGKKVGQNVLNNIRFLK